MRDDIIVCWVLLQCCGICTLLVYLLYEQGEVFTEYMFEVNMSGSSYHIPHVSHPRLPRLLNQEHHQQMVDLLHIIHQIFTSNNITYMLGYGTLLGSYMTHDVLPWDDDLDLVARLNDKQKILQILQNGTEHPEIEAMENAEHPSKMIKVYFRSGTSAGGYRWNWPFADIAFYEENASHVWFTEKNELNFKLNNFYPLHLRPFAGLWLPAQKQPEIFFRANYGTDKFVCRSYSWNHKQERHRRQRSVDCSMIEKYYPLVYRTPHQNGLLETLTHAGIAIYTVYVDEPASDNPFSPFTDE